MDTNKMREMSREQLEKFALSAEGGLFAGHLAKGEDGEYLNYAAQCYWLFWQASREAVVVELPSPMDAPPYASYEGGWNDMRDEAVDGIEEQGLKVKAREVKP
ncbi:hypothetical protein QEM43_004199 [Pseudomonas putida]|nr:hypothetical protein [Pseudomonas putida]